MRRSELTIDLGALRRNVRRPAGGGRAGRALGRRQGGRVRPRRARGVARRARGGRRRALRRDRRRRASRSATPSASARILVMGPLAPGRTTWPGRRGLDVAVSSLDHPPPAVVLHLKVDTGMGRFGIAAGELAGAPGANVVGVMSHLATADEEDETSPASSSSAFAAVRERFPRDLLFHVANSAATLRFPEAGFDAVRCGVALYGLSPFGDDPRAHGLEPVLSWRSYVAQVKALRRGESTGYGRRFVAKRKTRVGLVPVGYADGFRRGPDRHRGARRRDAAPGGRDGLDGLVRRRARRRGGGRSGHDPRRRRPRRGARARPRDDQLRAHVRDRPRPRAHRREGRRWMSRRSPRPPGEGAYVVGGAVRDELLGRPVLDFDVACREPAPSGAGLRTRGGRRGLRALRPPRRLARRLPRRADGRLHAAPRRDRGRSPHARLHGERRRAPARRRRARRPARWAFRICTPASCASSRDVGLRRRPAPAPPGRPPRGRARLPARRGERGARAGSRRARDLARPASGSSPSSRASRATASAAWTSSDSSSRSAEASSASRVTPRPSTTAISSSPRSARASFASRSRTSCAASPAPCSAPRPPADASPREIHRFRRATEPWALDALAYLDRPELAAAVVARARRRPARAAPARRRARPRARPRGRPAARAGRRGARGRDDLDAGRSARARAPRGSGYAAHLTVQPTGGVSATGGASPASTASSAWRSHGSAPASSV